MVFGILEIVDEITIGFMKIRYTIDVFIDLLEGFDTVSQWIFIEKLEMHVVKDRTLQCFESYLSHKKTIHST